MINEIKLILNEKLNEECKIIEIKYVYPEYTGLEKFIVFTNLDKNYLLRNHSKKLRCYEPYVVMNDNCYLAFYEYNKNEDKFRRRRLKNDSPYEDYLCKNSLVADCADIVIKKIMIAQYSKKLNNVLIELTDVQKRRLVLKYWKGLSNRSIARLEGKEKSTIDESINAALKKLKKYL